MASRVYASGWPSRSLKFTDKDWVRIEEALDLAARLHASDRRQREMVTIGAGRHKFACPVCNGSLFYDREVKLNTTGAEFFNMGWANESATGLVCKRCGYLHTFHVRGRRVVGA